MSKEIGKIVSCRHGFGGYQGAMIGYSFELGGKGWGCGDFWGTWATRSEDCKWTEETQKNQLGSATLRMKALLDKAHVDEFSKLKGVPIEAEFSDGSLCSWRILEEVL